MKTLNNAIGIKLLSIIFIIMLTQSCSKDTKCSFADTNIYYNVADSNKAKIPYTGSDTLVFVSDQGDTATLVGQNKKTYYNTITKNNNTVDCPKIENKNYENIDLVFLSKLDNLKILKVSVFAQIDINNLIFSTIRIYNFDKLLIGRTFEFIDNKSIEDSVFVNSSYLKGVYLDSEKTILFNYSNGVLKYKDENNSRWTLNQIK